MLKCAKMVPTNVPTKRKERKKYIYTYRFTSMAPNGSKWLQMAPNESVWLEMAQNDSKLLEIALNSSKN